MITIQHILLPGDCVSELLLNISQLITASITDSLRHSKIVLIGHGDCGHPIWWSGHQLILRDNTLVPGTFMTEYKSAFSAVMFGNCVVELCAAFCAAENRLIFYPNSSTKTHDKPTNNLFSCKQCWLLVEMLWIRHVELLNSECEITQVVHGLKCTNKPFLYTISNSYGMPCKNHNVTAGTALLSKIAVHCFCPMYQRGNTQFIYMGATLTQLNDCSLTSSRWCVGVSERKA